MDSNFFQPDCIVIGAPKCGTTALVDILAGHPRVCVSRIKEPHYFSRQPGDFENLRMGPGPKANGSFDRGNAWYRSLFECDGKPEDHVTIEATTDYIAREDTPSLMASSCREGLKLILMLRDPVQRVHSHYLHERRLGLDYPSLSGMLADGHPRLDYFLACTRYERHVARFRAALPGSPMLLLAMETLREEPARVMDAVMEHLGLDARDVAWDTRRERNVQLEPKSRRISRLTTRLRFNPFKRHLPDGVRRRLFRVFLRVQALNSKPLTSRALLEADKQKLAALLTAETTYHRALLAEGGIRRLT